MTGSVDVSLEMPCSRCLDPVKVDFHLEIDDEIDMKQTDKERMGSA